MSEEAAAIEKRRVAAEVLELGESLFDAMIEAACARRPVSGGAAAPYPVDDVRAAAGEFFTAMRVLLGLEPGGRR
ncbi:MAG: hypothetical protein HY331_06410 [Chloroflexi bacterium]|nr:hypothetical protein [Chloroflexota bacterium]